MPALQQMFSLPLASPKLRTGEKGAPRGTGGWASPGLACPAGSWRAVADPSSNPAQSSRPRNSQRGARLLPKSPEDGGRGLTWPRLTKMHYHQNALGRVGEKLPGLQQHPAERRPKGGRR